MPLLLLVTAVAAYLWPLWAPAYLQEEREHYLGHYRMILDVMAEGIEPDCINLDRAV